MSLVFLQLTKVSTNPRDRAINNLYDFIDSLAIDFKDAHKMVMDRIGVKKIIREEFLYLEGRDNG